MAHLDLGAPERALLLGLLALGGSAANPELTAALGVAVTGEHRRRLEAHKLVKSVKQGRSFHNTLTDEGWAWCTEELAATAPPRTGSLGRALYLVLPLLRAYLDRTDLSLGEFSDVATGRTTPAPAPEPDDAGTAASGSPDGQAGTAEAGAADSAAPERVEELVRAAYRKVAERPGSWVLLTEVRPLLADAPRDLVDETLRLMARGDDVHIVPEADQKTLTRADWDAAVRIGGKSKHLLAIEAR
ncbi:hypothetical protein LO762_27435 [Actinocorallia sp. API 0066]|uniref:hypothetical protein n=1 Tax=Actinocorallia sp. API 0066 TaxID=2896846 RepID=UPI001E4D3462|nr:hypothetical protein [Actinocorallia sp. API 0066]MCD0452886.1 hypothetical protein [Actinocorallia sp. API 0066]